MVKAAQGHNIAEDSASIADVPSTFRAIHRIAVTICTNVDVLPQELGAKFRTGVSHNRIAATANSASARVWCAPRIERMTNGTSSSRRMVSKLGTQRGIRSRV